MKKIYLSCLLFSCSLACALDVTVEGVVNFDPSGVSQVGETIEITFSLNPSPQAGLESTNFSEASNAWSTNTTAGVEIFTAVSSPALGGTLSLRDAETEPIELVRVRPGANFDFRVASQENDTGLTYGPFSVSQLFFWVVVDLAVEVGSEVAMVEYLQNYEGNHPVITSNGMAISSTGGTITMDITGFSIGEVVAPGWHGYSLSENGLIDTADWLGTVDISNLPWVWSYSLGTWFLDPDPTTDALAGGWFYFPR
ncbi:hypothetical protein G0Q06_12690 [Puniceicoccales bacterium CK1056]|uniref:SbsA Ig-like domain-containing protein n=1 Tax=Oceanipulchritudo coccoides TaxID=2706888 RepID=A0A6B2M689_9BACT|nr:hypothetical protein [Oceanipulchritudo coccoides]NDV63315.1 hypothetical protein [Oceanipulchritudo coccoides]